MSCQEIFVSSITPHGRTCSTSKASDFSSNHKPLTEEKRQIAEAAKRRAVEILRDALKKKDRVLMEKPQDLFYGDSGDPRFWMERHAILTEELVQCLISELEAVKFKEDLTKENTYAYVYPKSGDKTVYLCKKFWEASADLKKDSQPGTLIHEVSHFLGIQDITYSKASINVACRGKLAMSKVDSEPSISDLNPLAKAILNANNIEYEFEITLNHKGRYEKILGKYSCCGEKAVNSVCEKAVPDEFLIHYFMESSPGKKNIIEMLQSLLSARDKLQRCLAELREIADAIDNVHKGATKANVTGGAVRIAGGITAIAGLCLAPFSFGASLGLSLTGLAVSTAGGVTSAAATTTDIVASKVKKETVDKLLQECLAELGNIIKAILCLESFMSPFTQIGAGAGRAALNITKMVNVSEFLANAGKAGRFAGAAFYILTRVTPALGISFVAKDSMELHNCVKTDLAAKIREAVKEMEQVIGHVNDGPFDEMHKALTPKPRVNIMEK